MFEFFKRLFRAPKRVACNTVGAPYRETYHYVGDMRAPEIDELVGVPYSDKKGGRKGVVVSNTHLTITVEFNGKT